MPEQFTGKVEILNTATENPTITLRGEVGDVEIGGGGENGKLIVLNSGDVGRVLIDAETGEVQLYGSDGTLLNMFLNATNGNLSLRGNLIVFNGDLHAMRFNPVTAELTVGADGIEGDVRVVDVEGRIVMHMNGSNATLRLGAAGNEGDLQLVDDDDRVAISADAGSAWLRVGTTENEGDIEVQDAAARRVFHMNGETATLTVGAQGNEGDLHLVDGGGRRVFDFNSEFATLKIGATGNEGDLQVFDGGGRRVFDFNSEYSVLKIGAEGNEGDLEIYDGGGRKVFEFNAEFGALYLGADGNEGDLIVRDDNGKDRIHLDGKSGDIKLYGADCAEEFDVIDAADPGVVMVIDPQGKLRASDQAYDHRVAGVVAGAGDFRPGIVLGHIDDQAGRLPIALTGRTFCKVDAAYGEIHVGDLLTTSPTPGHAMRVDDPFKAFGAVIGKAMRPLTDGQGLIPILIALQ
jgi:hypothetical protein